MKIVLTSFVACLFLCGLVHAQGSTTASDTTGSGDAETDSSTVSPATSSTGYSTVPSATSSTGNSTVPPAANSTGTSDNGTVSATTTPAATVNPCADVNCQENAACGDDGKCRCNEGFVEGGDGSCIRMCAEYSRSINYTDIYSEPCDNSTNATTDSSTISVTFQSSQVGTTVTANVTCLPSCVNNANRSIAYVVCQSTGSYSDPTYIDCSADGSSNEEILNNAIVDTANPDEITQDTVNQTVTALENVSQQPNITAENADDIMTVTNNLLLASTTSGQDAVAANSETIITSVNNMAQNVELTNDGSDEYGFYDNQQPTLALAVVGPATVVTRSFTGGQTYYYGITGEVSSNLVQSNLTLTTDAPSPNSAYISASSTGSSSQRITFTMYSDVQSLFPDSNINVISEDIVYSVNGTNVANGFKMNFPITPVIETQSNTFDGNNQLDCIRWSGDIWQSADDCHDYSASGGYASCTCTQSGQYTVRTFQVEVEVTGDESLSGGAIAGIVIGSLAGVAIIGGLVYYFGFRSKGYHSTAEMGSASQL